MAHAGAASKLRRKHGRKGVNAPDSRTAAGPKGAASKLRKKHLAEKVWSCPIRALRFGRGARPPLSQVFIWKRQPTTALPPRGKPPSRPRPDYQQPQRTTGPTPPCKEPRTQLSTPQRTTCTKGCMRAHVRPMTTVAHGPPALPHTTGQTHHWSPPPKTDHGRTPLLPTNATRAPPTPHSTGWRIAALATRTATALPTIYFKPHERLAATSQRLSNDQHKACAAGTPSP